MSGLFMIAHGDNEEEDGMGEERVECGNDCEEIVETDVGLQFSNESPPQISLNALTGINNYKTMRVKGYIGKKHIHILVDRGSTHNFLDLQTTKRLGCKMKNTCPLLVSVENGPYMTTNFMCQQLALIVGNMTYEIDVMELPLGACEMVLGIQWLANLDDIKWNFQKLTMSFTYKNQYVMLRVEKVEYLGHVILAQGVATDPTKIQAIRDWPIPTNTNEAQLAFEKLKHAMISSPVLALPNFSKEFVVEIDACGTKIGAVLIQEGHPIAYLSKALHFKIRTGHLSLKYLLNQRLTTPFQMKWLPKLLGYDYEIDYKKRSDNTTVDALSRVDNQVELSSLIGTTITSVLLEKIKES
nr:retrotransposon-related protein [Tanacetum cinerariifolium]